MCTPRPVRPLRYAGSVATSVLPSPVAISAILPSWSTMPPISWTSKWRMPTVRRAASRQTAKASGRISSSGSPPSIRFLNSSDFARRPASSSGLSEASRPLMACTTGIMRLTSRSCLVPKIFFSSASIISTSLYRARSRDRPAQKLAGVAARRLGDPIARDHPGDLVHACLSGHGLGADPRPAAAHALGDPHVVGGARGLHPGLGELARRHAGESLGRVVAALRELVRGARKLRVELAEHALLLGQNFFVSAQALELARRLGAEREHRRFGVAVLALE